MELTRLQEVILYRLRENISVSYLQIRIDKSIWIEALEDLKDKGLVVYKTQKQSPFEGEPSGIILTPKGKIEAEKYHGHNL